MNNFVLKKKFIEGLKQYNLTYEEVNNNWKYCGGDHDHHWSYFRLVYPQKQLPEHKEKCVCDHDIERNCYITDGNEIIVIGSCCIKRFMTHNARTCGKCDKPHKNRIVNLCNSCKNKYCHECFKPKSLPVFKLCYSCYQKR